MPTSLHARSLAQASLLREKVRVLLTQIAGCGLKPRALLGSVCPDTSLLKTGQTSLITDYQQSLSSLPPSGMMQNGRIYQATSLLSKPDENGFFLLPTPVKKDSQCVVRTRLYFGVKRPGVGYTLGHFLRDGPADGKYPNPELTEALMTFPISYTDLSVPEMPSYHL
jgi:hypothetical protein